MWVSRNNVVCNTLLCAVCRKHTFPYFPTACEAALMILQSRATEIDITKPSASLLWQTALVRRELCHCSDHACSGSKQLLSTYFVSTRKSSFSDIACVYFLGNFECFVSSARFAETAGRSKDICENAAKLFKTKRNSCSNGVTQVLVLCSWFLRYLKL